MSREPRAYTIVRDRCALLRVEGRPGHLRSMAAPPEGWQPPVHPFVDASSLDPSTEDELRTLLMGSGSFADFLGQLIAAGCDVMSADNDTWSLPPARRITAAGKLVGVMWAQEGQFASLAWQPGHGEAVYPHATVTAYTSELADTLLGALAATSTIGELELVMAGLDLAVGPDR